MPPIAGVWVCERSGRVFHFVSPTELRVFTAEAFQAQQQDLDDETPDGAAAADAAATPVETATLAYDAEKGHVTFASATTVVYAIAEQSETRTRLVQLAAAAAAGEGEEAALVLVPAGFSAGMDRFGGGDDDEDGESVDMGDELVVIGKRIGP